MLMKNSALPKSTKATAWTKDNFCEPGVVVIDDYDDNDYTERNAVDWRSKNKVSPVRHQGRSLQTYFPLFEL